MGRQMNTKTKIGQTDLMVKQALPRILSMDHER